MMRRQRNNLLALDCEKRVDADHQRTGAPLCGRGESRDITPGPVPRFELPGHDEQRGREDQQRGRRKLDAAQVAGAFLVAVQLLAHTSST